MAELGIAAAVVNPLSVAGVHHGDDANARYLTRSVNEALAKFSSGAPDRLGFFATLPMPDVDGALAEMAYALDELGADGVILLSHQNGVYVGDPAASRSMPSWTGAAPSASCIRPFRPICRAD